MKDYQSSIEKLRRDAAEAALIRDLATDGVKRDMYSRLHVHFSRLADEVERALSTSRPETETGILKRDTPDHFEATTPPS